jgi:hypothetical protein
MGQAELEWTGTVLERTSLILDLLALSRFDHACSYNFFVGDLSFEDEHFRFTTTWVCQNRERRN